jgi:hypothetical protein
LIWDCSEEFIGIVQNFFEIAQIFFDISMFRIPMGLGLDCVVEYEFCLSTSVLQHSFQLH